MLTLAVTAREESLERMREPLANRDIEVRFLPHRERILRLDDNVDGFDVGFVYPSRWMEGDVMDARLSVPWVNGREAVLTSRNKAGVIARLRAGDIPVPDTVLVSNPVDESALREAFDRLGPPVVVKPNSATWGIGVARADDLDSFLGIADYLGAIHAFEPTGDKSFLVQEYLPDARDVRAMVIDGEYAGAVERRFAEGAADAGRWKHNVHRDAVAVGIELSPELRQLAERVAACLDIPYLGVDILATEDGPRVGETNARPTIDDESKYEPGFYDRLACLIKETAATPR